MANERVYGKIRIDDENSYVELEYEQTKYGTISMSVTVSHYSQETILKEVYETDTVEKICAIFNVVHLWEPLKKIIESFPKYS